METAQHGFVEVRLCGRRDKVSSSSRTDFSNDFQQPENNGQI